MKEKLTLQDLVDLLAKKTSLTKKEADTFFREFFAIISDCIFESEPVKIKDFGTFKLTKVNSRESVNVNTGEKIEIPAHSKLSFLPDKLLKELVNKPFSQFETTLLEDGVDFASLDTTTDVDNVAEDEDTSLEDEQTALEVSEQDVEQKEQVENEDKKEVAPTKSQRVQVAPKRVATPQKSYIYTYTSVSENEEEKPITIVLPKDFGIYKSSSKRQVEEMKIDIAEDVNIVVPDELDETNDISIERETVVNLSAENEPAEESVPSKDTLVQPKTFEEANRVHEKIGHLRDVLKSFNEPILASEEIAEEIVLESESDRGRVADVNEKSTFIKSIDPIKSDHTLVDDSDEIESKENFDCFDTEDRQWHTLASLDQKNAESFIDKDDILGINTLKKEKEDADEDEDVYYQPSNYYDSKPSFFARVWRKIPLIIFLLIVLGFGVYSFVGLFTKRYNYEYYLGRTNLTDVDTLPFKEQQGIPPILEDSLAAQSVADSSVVDSVVETKPSKYVINERLSVSPNRATNNRVKPSNGQGQKIVVKEGSHLRSIARQYYGNDEFWVYIYEENKSKIKNPNSITAGTVLIIPDLAKYNTSINQEGATEKAKNRSGVASEN